jgi:hypothetical protein
MPPKKRPRTRTRWRGDDESNDDDDDNNATEVTEAAMLRGPQFKSPRLRITYPDQATPWSSGGGGGGGGGSPSNSDDSDDPSFASDDEESDDAADPPWDAAKRLPRVDSTDVPELTFDVDGWAGIVPFSKFNTFVEFMPDRLG